MTTPGSYSLSIYRGDTHRWQFKLWTDEDKTQPADLTDVTVRSEIRDRPSGKRITPIVCAVTLPNIIDAELDAATSAAITISRGAWDLQLTYLSGIVVTVLAGQVFVTADITDSTVAGP